MKKKRKMKLLFGILTITIILGGIVTYGYLNRDKIQKLIEDNPIMDIIEPEPEPPKKVQVIDEDSDSRSYAVMINNNSAVWKFQSGLNDAYIVYELLVEGGITREMAVFQNANVGKIQSIRSSRHYYLDYALENDAIYVHWGWSPQAQSDIYSLHIPNINGLTYEGVYFFRDKTVTAAYEHKGYITGENMAAAAERLKYRTTTEQKKLLKYDPDPIEMKGENVQDAAYVALKFSGGYVAKFFYNEETKLYEKNQNNTEMYDFTSGERITTKNIIAYQIGYSNIAGDNKGRLDASTVGSGTGYFISEGKAVPITWEKTSRSAQTQYKLEDGTELVVNDGNTYIGIIPKNQTITINPTIE